MIPNSVKYMFDAFTYAHVYLIRSEYMEGSVRQGTYLVVHLVSTTTYVLHAPAEDLWTRVFCAYLTYMRVRL